MTGMIVNIVLSFTMFELFSYNVNVYSYDSLKTQLQFNYSIILRSSATANLASVLARTSSSSTPGASSVNVRPPFLRSTWNTHYETGQQPNN